MENRDGEAAALLPCDGEPADFLHAAATRRPVVASRESDLEVATAMSFPYRLGDPTATATPARDGDLVLYQREEYPVLPT
jgi:hypothetical protein